MLRHLLKLIWKRKGRNLMLTLEILLAFVIVFAIAAFTVRNAQLYRMPTGFDARDVWSVYIEDPSDTADKFTPALYDQFKRGLEALPGVRQVAFGSAAPYSNHTMINDFQAPEGGKRIRTEMLEVSDDFLTLLDVKLAEGRAFNRGDDGALARPVIINRRMAKTLFGSDPALGRQFDTSEPENKTRDMMRVVGVIEAFRKKGELDAPDNFMFIRNAPTVNQGNVRHIIIKLAPGTPRAFEETLQRQLKLIRNDLGYEISPLSSQRKMIMSEKVTPMIVLAVVAAFMLLMVGFGLFGVLWQNTTRRIPEIGLRRAIGASAGNIYRQIIAEQFLLSSLAMAAGLLLLVQLPITGVMGESLNWSVFALAVLLSMGVIYLLSLLCSVYPGWRASRLSPTEALHYE